MVNPNGPGVVTRLVSFSNDLSALAPQASEAVGQQSITIPLDIPRLNADGTGTYYLCYLYVATSAV